MRFVVKPDSILLVLMRRVMRTTSLLILRGYTGGAPKAFGNGRIAKVSDK